jgi:hypothetical protein
VVVLLLAQWDDWAYERMKWDAYELSANYARATNEDCGGKLRSVEAPPTPAHPKLKRSRWVKAFHGTG